MKLPRDLNVYVTSKCNFKCRHCQRQIKGKPVARDMTVDLLVKIFEVYPITSVCLAGFGEPLMNPRIRDIVRFLNIKGGIKPGFITNGSLIKDNADWLGEAELMYLSVSLNTGDKREHERITGTKTFTDILTGIAQLKKVAEYPIGLSAIYFNEHSNIESLIRLAGYFDINFIQFTNSLPYDAGALKGILTEEHKQELKELKELPGAEIIKHWPVPIRNECPHNCNSPWHSIGIDGDGFISGCRRVLGPSDDFGRFDTPNIWEEGHELNLLRAAVGGKPNKYTETCNWCFGNYK